ncbi:hypothetical protein LX32DRAFT_1941 [Colletotrichum zoysiae]|uniref:Zn(2)-C6 fungal-type domain-containing protein n=1 Tax=Colletotrichum zoysiae TaxID=1216348 RepID=A0AAD9M824_9PEZI|nr:hypothetical protein LX32DRAFT_1941 [Colletotrichum zoysiae]
MVRDGGDRGDGDAMQSPIACESCRQRKRRCDRKLPFCLQCSHEPGRCQYPEQSKRGIPNGYLNKLETRLAETEAALFMVLSGALQTPGSGSASSSPLLPQAAWKPRQNKIDHVREWEVLPLQSSDEIQAWFRSKAAENSDPTPEPPGASPQALISSVSDPMFAMRDPETVPTQRPPPDVAIEPRLRSMTPASTTPVERVPSGSGSKAEELSKSQRNLYF